MLPALLVLAGMIFQGRPLLILPHDVALGAVDFGVYRRSSAADTTRTPLGSWHLEYRAVTHKGEPAIAYVSAFRSPNGRTTVDSVLVLREGLRPVAERSHQPDKVMVLEFSPDSVVAHVTDSAGPHVSVARSLASYFNSTDTPLAVLALPPRIGYRVVLQEYTYEAGGLVNDTLAVVGLNGSELKVRSATASAIWMWTIDAKRHTLLAATRGSRSSPVLIEFVRRGGPA